MKCWIELIIIFVILDQPPEKTNSFHSAELKITQPINISQCKCNLWIMCFVCLVFDSNDGSNHHYHDPKCIIISSSSSSSSYIFTPSFNHCYECYSAVQVICNSYLEMLWHAALWPSMSFIHVLTLLLIINPFHLLAIYLLFHTNLPSICLSLSQAVYNVLMHIQIFYYGIFNVIIIIIIIITIIIIVVIESQRGIAKIHLLLVSSSSFSSAWLSLNSPYSQFLTHPYHHHHRHHHHIPSSYLSPALSFYLRILKIPEYLNFNCWAMRIWEWLTESSISNALRIEPNWGGGGVGRQGECVDFKLWHIKELLIPLSLRNSFVFKFRDCCALCFRLVKQFACIRSILQFLPISPNVMRTGEMWIWERQVEKILHSIIKL